jgi:co-chaperonin GroES (HSP10)
MKISIPGHRVFVKPIDVVGNYQETIPNELKAKGFEIKVGGKLEEQRHNAAADQGIVVGLGEMCWKDIELGYGTPDWKPWCKVGDKVSFVKYAGRDWFHPETNQRYLLINDVDVLLVEDEGEIDV